MVREVTRFEAKDGSLFHTAEDADEHDLMMEKYPIIQAYFNDYRVSSYKVYKFVKEYTKGWK